MLASNFCLFIAVLDVYILEWLWENLPLMHKDKYWEICNSIIQSVISWEGLKAAGLQFAMIL